MSVVAILPTKAKVEELWERYNALNREMIDDPSVLNRSFCERWAKAKADFDRAYLAWSGQ